MKNAIAQATYSILAVASFLYHIGSGEDMSLYTFSFLILSAIYGTAKSEDK